MSKEGSVAPKERINIKYIPNTGDAQAEVELPLKTLVVGDFLGKEQETSVEERKAINVDKNNFKDVMAASNLELTTSVPDRLSDEKDKDIAINLSFKSVEDFSPDRIAQSVPELKKLISLREALVALKGPLGNIPEFRTRLQSLINSDKDRDQLLAELKLVSEAEDKPKS